MRVYINEQFSQLLQTHLISRGWRGFYSSNPKRLFTAPRDAYSKDNMKAYILHLDVDEKCISGYDYAFCHQQNPTPYVILNHNVYGRLLRDLGVGVEKKQYKYDLQYKYDFHLLPCQLSQKEITTDITKDLIMKHELQREWKEYIDYKKAKKDPCYFHKAFFGIDLATWKDQVGRILLNKSSFIFNNIKKMNNLEMTLQELTYDKSKLLAMIELVKLSKPAVEKLNQTIADLSIKVSETQNAVSVLENYLKYTVDEVEQAIEVLETNIKPKKK